MPKQPSIRQKKYAKNMEAAISKKGGPKRGDKKQAALDAGFSESVALSPKDKIETKSSFRTLLDKIIPEEVLARKLNEGLEANKSRISPHGDLKGETPDYKTRHAYLETSFKLRGDFAPIEKNISLKTHEDTIAELEEDD